MPRLSGLRVLVAGAGAVGSAVALRLQQAGGRVVLADPAALGDNASGVAAGMLAPAFEAVLDPVSQDHFDMLRAARERWDRLAPDLAAAAGLDRSGALFVGDRAAQERMAARLRALGAQVSRLTPAQAEALSPGLLAPEGAVFAPEDWRLEPRGALRALQDAFRAAGGEIRAGALHETTGSAAILEDGGRLDAEVVVLATGMPPRGLKPSFPEASLLSPIKGQIARARGAHPSAGPAVRAEGVYVAPSPSGAVVGATMEAGVDDRTVEGPAVERLMDRARRLFPDLAEAQADGAAGVRAATPDGLPLVGPSRARGLFLALGARRNGWLLALDIAEAVLAQLGGGRAPEHYRPERFERRGG
jgi:glycine oxidase